MGRRVKRRMRLNPKAPLAIVSIMIVIVIGIIGIMFWVFVNDDLKNTNITDINKIGTSSGDVTSTTESSDITSSQNTSTVSGETASTPEVPEFDPLATRVAKSESVDKAYFDDAVFIGDSISKGLKTYNVLPPGNVVADQNVGINQIANDEPVYSIGATGEKQTLFEALDKLAFVPKKVYIMLGSNGLPWYENEKHMPYYYIVLDKIIAKYPDATIYVQSVTPISAQAEKDYANRGRDFTNKKINEFNALVEKMCEEKDVYYLSVKDALVDESDQLADTFSSQDGVHFSKSGHEAMYGYYKTHTVPYVLPNGND